MSIGVPGVLADPADVPVSFSSLSSPAPPAPPLVRPLHPPVEHLGSQGQVALVVL